MDECDELFAELEAATKEKDDYIKRLEAENKQKDSCIKELKKKVESLEVEKNDSEVEFYLETKEECRIELWRQEQEKYYKLEREMKCSRRILNERRLRIRGVTESLITLSNQKCHIAQSCQPRWNMEEYNANQYKEILKWHEEKASEKLKLEEELRQLQESEVKQLTKLKKFYKPDVYDRYIKGLLHGYVH